MHPEDARLGGAKPYRLTVALGAAKRLISGSGDRELHSGARDRPFEPFTPRRNGRTGFGLCAPPRICEPDSRGRGLTLDRPPWSWLPLPPHLLPLRETR